MKMYKKHIFSLITLTILAGCSGPWSSSKTTPQATESKTIVNNPHITNINSTNDFKKLINTKNSIVIKFSAAWCGACKSIQPLYEEIAQEFSKQYTFAVVDIDKTKDLGNEYKITGIPVFMFFKNGEETDQNKRIIGSSVSKSEFITTMQAALQ